MRTSVAGLRALAVAGALGIVAGLPAGEARAIGAVGFQAWDGGATQPSVAPGGSASASGAGLASSMAGNPGLDGSAWAHTGEWWILELQASPEVRIRVQADDAGELSPGVSVWATGAAPFDGGTTAFGGETSTAGFGTPHSFNAVGPLGDAGTLWMQAGQGGNAQELVAYAISGPSFLDPAGWGETIEQGAHDMRLGDGFAAGVSGSVGPGFVELSLQGVEAGWFAIYVGGTDHAQAGGSFTLSVASVPEPGTALLVLLGVGALARGGRRRASH
jgi:hypothetical protein